MPASSSFSLLGTLMSGPNAALYAVTTRSGGARDIVSSHNGGALALIETLSAKLRVFRAPEFLATAFLFAVLG